MDNWKKERRQHPERFECGCGNKGVAYKRGGVVCARCLAIEERMYYTKREFMGESEYETLRRNKKVSQAEPPVMTPYRFHLPRVSAALLRVETSV